MNIFAITDPIYVLIGIGFLAGRFGLFSAAEMRAMGKWVVNFAVPALLFTALSQRSIGEILHGSYLLVYAGGSLIALLIGDLVVRLGRKKDTPFAAMTGLGGHLQFNVGFLSAPTFGPCRERY